MSTKRIDGALFERMIKCGLNSLAAKEKELNAMNVFPVSDGDTGTNMLLTLKNGIKCAGSVKNLSEYLERLSDGMLLGARGNSGVILSQLFKGFYLELSRRASATAVELRNAFIRAYKLAYESVLHPTEGTILTVAREGIEQAARQLRRLTDIESLLSAYISNMELSLDNTPALLPVLREAGVLDSGGMGYIAIIRGMLGCLTGEETYGEEASAADAGNGKAPDLSLFTADSAFDKGYCMEFILQLMNSDAYDRRFDETKVKAALERLGNSIVWVKDASRVKVHIHTHRPAPVIETVQRYGEFLTFKLENMQLQHNEHLRNGSADEDPGRFKVSPDAELRMERKDIAVIAAVNGAGVGEIFKNLGCDLAYECGPSMNASPQEFLDAVNLVNARDAIILPGNPNLVPAARQAALLAGQGVHVLATNSIPQSYFALAMDIQDGDGLDSKIERMREGMSGIDTLLVAVAAKRFEHDGKLFEKGQWVALDTDGPVLAAPDAAGAIVAGLASLPDIDDRETLVLFRGKNVSPADEEAVQKALKARWPMMEVDLLDGGQTIYDWMIGIA